MTTTYAEILGRHDVEIPAHLAAQAEVPILVGVPQRQGDVYVKPYTGARTEGVQVQAEGVAVVRGENGGNTHLLVAEGAVTWAPEGGTGLRLGIFTVAKNAVAYLLHPEHGASAFGAGSYECRRKREQADIVRIVQD